MKPYLYHTIITDLEKGGVFHYFGKHKGTNPKYKGSGRSVLNAKALNRQCKKDGLPERYVLEHIIVQEFDTYKECSKNEKFIIALGKEQFGCHCLNIRTEEKENSPYIFDEKFQEQVSINKSKANLKKWADPELKAKRLAKLRETLFINQKKMGWADPELKAKRVAKYRETRRIMALRKFDKTPFSVDAVREMAKYMTEYDFVRKMKTYDVKITSCKLFDFTCYVRMSPFMDMKVFQKEYKQNKSIIDLAKNGITLEQYQAFREGLSSKEMNERLNCTIPNCRIIIKKIKKFLALKRCQLLKSQLLKRLPGIMTSFITYGFVNQLATYHLKLKLSI